MNNLPIAGALLEICPTDPATGQRLSLPGYRKTVGPSGLWGPFDAQPGQAYEFVITAPGYATTHIYRSPFPRSSAIVHLRAERIADADKDAIANKGSILTLSRPRGYFDVQRDTVSMDGQSPAPGLPASGAGLSTSKIKLKDVPQRPIQGVFNRETVTGRAWPAAENHVTTLESTF